MFVVCRNEGRLLGRIARSFSSKQEVFDRNAVIAHRDRIAQRQDMSNYGYFRKDTIEEITDRLLDINRKFPVAIDLGCWDGQFASGLHGRGGVQQIYECDSSFEMLKLARKNNDAHADPARITKAVCSDQRGVFAI
ncbi:hypothetical protein WA588_001950 [Blastocystis sp. NMH]